MIRLKKSTFMFWKKSISRREKILIDLLYSYALILRFYENDADDKKLVYQALKASSIGSRYKEIELFNDTLIELGFVLPKRENVR